MYQALQRGTGRHDMSCGNGTGQGGKKYIKNRTAGTGRRDNNISSIAHLVQAPRVCLVKVGQAGKAKK